MKISYKNNKIKRMCEDAKQAEKQLVADGAYKLKTRLVQLQAFSLEILLRDGVGGCHKLTGNRKDQYAMHLNEPFRLIFTVRVVNNATIIEIVDYHKK